MESLEEAVVVNQLGNLIRRCTGDSSLPDPSKVIRQYFSYLKTSCSIKIIWNEKAKYVVLNRGNDIFRTSWVSDPNFLGTYSFPGLKAPYTIHNNKL